ncbi:leucine--tRNA ligase [Patescibacteria group bacterium]|nr:leucine--tRNA ligase [Patescibacteria group bacterium]
MAKEYDHKAIEKKWQDAWAAAKTYETPDSVSGKENFYTLVEFPYPSGDLHIGHWYAYSAPDIFARMKRMQGKNVLYPFGFDSFGLPAENAAIKRNIDPAEWIAESVTKMRAQIKTMGASFDWSREINTSLPEYYKWTQWLFLKLYEKGLAYRGKGLVNWCPTDQTVLANEQVIEGKCERCGSDVIQKDLEQWFFRITAYAERLLSDLDPLDWPEPIKESQRNWIGKSEGAEIDFEVSGGGKITVFTTRPDTLYGATYLVLAPEHPLLKSLPYTNRSEVDAYIEKTKRKSAISRMADKEKTGEKLEGITAINPASKEEIPVYVADYVLGGYGTGALMAVPAHDERDFEFAQKYSIKSIKVVIALPTVDQADFKQVSSGTGIGNFVGHPIEFQITDKATGKIIGSKFENLGSVCHTCPGVLVDSGDFTGMDSEEAKKKITEFVKGRIKTTYKFRDWLVSRQRYWGAPIPVVYDPVGKAHPIPEEHLPWLLPNDADIKPKGTSPLGSSKELLERTEKIFGKGWKPETDTMDGFVDNSWYFLRYLDPKNEKEFSSLEKQKAWMPIARYSGGAEHTTVHVLYSRFLYKALFDMGLTTHAEPYLRRMNRGIILAEDGRKMSKRWGNTINPDEQVENVGADAVRTYLAFIGPYNEVGSFPWSTNGLIGVRRFLERVAGFADSVSDTPLPKYLDVLLHQSIKKVGEDIESMKFNTSVSQLMILSNELQKLKEIPKQAYETFLVLLAPFAPHLAEELWHELGNSESIHRSPWPSYDASKLQSETVTIAVQIAGKTRGTCEVGRIASEAEVTAEARKDAKLAAFIPENPKKVIFVPGRIINFIP